MNAGIIREKARDIMGIVWNSKDNEQTVKDIGKILWEMYNKGVEQK